MKDSTIMVAESNESNREKICEYIRKKGYKIYQASDGAGALRIARTVRPTITIIDTNLWGMNAFEVGNIIEKDRLSTVIFMTKNLNQDFYEHLNKMNLYVYILKPIRLEQLLATIEFAIMNFRKISLLNDKIEKLEITLEGKKKIDIAKGLLIEKLKMTEKEAYQAIRKKSMDLCMTMDKVAEQIINKYS